MGRTLIIQTNEYMGRTLTIQTNEYMGRTLTNSNQRVYGKKAHQFQPTSIQEERSPIPTNEYTGRTLTNSNQRVYRKNAHQFQQVVEHALHWQFSRGVQHQHRSTAIEQILLDYFQVNIETYLTR
jgi:hypothetical protein